MISRSCQALILVLLLFAWLNPAMATRLSPADFTCIFCGQKFTDQRIWSTNVMDRDAEFRPLAMGLDPLPYYVHACPHCGYPNTSDQDPLNDREKTGVGKFLTAYRQSHGGKMSPAEKYEVLANICIIRKLPANKIAYAYQRAAWMADDAHDETAARKFRAATLEYLTKALENREVEAKLTPISTYMAGELNRRLGRFDEALQWFARVKPDGPTLETLLKQQSQLAQKKDARPDRRLDMRLLEP